MAIIDRKSSRLQSDNISFDIWFIQILFMLRKNNVSMQRRRFDFPIGLIYISSFFGHKRIYAGRQRRWEGEAFTFIPWNPSFGWKLINSYHHKNIQLPHMNSVLWMKVNWFISSLNSSVLGWWGQKKFCNQMTSRIFMTSLSSQDSPTKRSLFTYSHSFRLKFWGLVL